VAEASGVVSLAGAVVSVGAALATVVLTRRAAVRDRRQAAAELALRYRERCCTRPSTSRPACTTSPAPATGS
jgi:hypothetical protein